MLDDYFNAPPFPDIYDEDEIDDEEDDEERDGTLNQGPR